MQRFILERPLNPIKGTHASPHWRVRCITVPQQAACRPEAQLGHLTAVAAGPQNGFEARTAARRDAGLVLQPCLWRRGAVALPKVLAGPGHGLIGVLKSDTCPCFWNAASSLDSETSEFLLPVRNTIGSSVHLFAAKPELSHFYQRDFTMPSAER